MPTVIIYWSPGRTTEQKARVIHEVTEALVIHGSARREDVVILFQNIEAGDAGRGGQQLSSPTARAKSENPPSPNEE